VGPGFVPSEQRTRTLSSSGCPELPSIKGKIQTADKLTRDGQNRRRDIGIDQLIEVMEQEPALVGLDAGSGFEQVLKQRQRARQKKFRQ